MKIRLCLFLAVLFLFTGCADSGNRHVYTPEERAEWDSEAGMIGCGFFVPDEKQFETNIIASDVALVGTVMDEGVSKVEPIFGEAWDDGPQTTVTAFQLRVQDVLAGSCDAKEITLKFYWPYQTRPYKGDKLVLFLVEQPVASEFPVEFYTPTSADNDSVFAVNPPDNTIFAFSKKETLTAYDGQKLSDFKKNIEEALDTFRTATEYPYIAGEAGLSALTENSPLYEEYRGYYPEFFEKKALTNAETCGIVLK